MKNYRAIRSGHGHTRPGEPSGDAARRLREEMGFDCELREAFASPDYAEVGGALIEHEYDHVLVGAYEGEPVPDPAEVAEWRWVSTGELRRALFANEDDLQDARQVTVQREGNEDG